MNQTHNLGIASSMIYYLSYRKAIYSFFLAVCDPNSWRVIALDISKQNAQWQVSWRNLLIKLLPIY